MRSALGLVFIVTGLFLLAVLWPKDKGEIAFYFPEAKNQTEAVTLINSTTAKILSLSRFEKVFILMVDEENTKKALQMKGGIAFDPVKFSGCLGMGKNIRRLQDQGRL